MVIDCTLSSLKVPGFPELEPEFGTKKPDMQHITARENNINAMLPFKRQRPFPVTENSTTSVIEAHTPFVIQAAGITLTLGAGAFTGCAVKVFNASGGEATVVYGENDGENAKIPAAKNIGLEWTGFAWLVSLAEAGTPEGLGAYVDGCGRNLFDVFGITEGTLLEKIAACFAEIRRRCNNYGEIDESGVPDFRGIAVGDYIDGIDLSLIPANQNSAANTAGQEWNDTYKNNRILVSGFNTFKQSGDTEVTQNHICFTFRNIPLKARMNTSDTNTGGYAASVMKTFLESTFTPALKAQLSGGGAEDYILPIRKQLSTKGSWSWGLFSVWLPSEEEVFGCSSWGEKDFGDGVKVHLPIYQKTSHYRCKRYNGARVMWWESTPAAAYSTAFAYVGGGGNAGYTGAGAAAGGVAPAFCVA